MIFSRIRNLDWVLIFGLFILALASLLALASAHMNFFWKQLMWYVLAFLIIFFGSTLDWLWLIKQNWFRYGLYAVSVLLLFVSHLQSSLVRGTKSWLSFGGFQFEPSELAKLALIFLLAGFFSRRHIEAWLGRNLAISLFYALIPIGLVATQPDFGSASILMSIWIGFLLLSGIHYKRFSIGFGAAVLIAILAWSFFLKPYQKDRITGFLFQDRDPLGVNYNVIQSKIAIGSAGLWGKGFGQGTQTHFNFLPESQTDFLFAAFVEEWGIAGGIFLIGIFLLVIFRIVRIGLGARNNSGKFVILGTGIVFITQFLINVGSNVGLVPVAGITFPFVSYGGSSLLTAAILISIIEHIKLESSI